MLRQREHLAVEHEQREGESKSESHTRREIIDTLTSWIEARKDTKEELHRRDSLLLRNATTEIV